MNFVNADLPFQTPREGAIDDSDLTLVHLPGFLEVGTGLACVDVGLRGEGNQPCYGLVRVEGDAVVAQLVDIHFGPFALGEVMARQWIEKSIQEKGERSWDVLPTNFFINVLQSVTGGPTWWRPR
jgi:hypothetical protein